MGKNNENRDYRMQGVSLECVTQEKDLGVVINMEGKQAAQCQAAIRKANRGLGCIRRRIIYKLKEEVLTLYRNFGTTHEGHWCHRECTAQGYWINSGPS